MCNEKDQLQMNDFLENVLTSIEKQKHRIDFIKKCIYFLVVSMTLVENNETHGQGLNKIHAFQKGRYHLVLLLREDESLLNSVSRHYLGYIITKITTTYQLRDYNENTVKPKVIRLKQSVEKCRHIKNNILSKKAKEKGVEYSWRC